MSLVKLSLAALLSLAPAVGLASTANLSRAMHQGFIFYTEHGATIECGKNSCTLEGNVTASLPVVSSATVQRGGYFLCRTADTPAVMSRETFANLTVTVGGEARWPLECIRSAATSIAHEKVPCRRIDYANYAKSVKSEGFASGTYLQTAQDDEDEAAGK